MFGGRAKTSSLATQSPRALALALCFLSLAEAQPQPRLVKDFNGTSADSSIYFPTVVEDSLFLAANGKIWKTNGTTEGTVMVNPNGGSEPWLLTAAGGLLFFTDRKQSDGTGVELWVSDGTAPGTYMVKDIFPGAGDSGIAVMVECGGRVYFAADDGAHGIEIWTSDGTANGTFMVKDITPGSVGGIYYLDNWELVHVGGTLFFRGGNSIDGFGLWKSDGTELGTVLVREIPFLVHGTPLALTPAATRLYFLGNDEDHGVEPWVSDGTPEGTYMIQDINPGPIDSCPTMECFWETGTLGDTFFFSAEDPMTIRLWVSEGRPGDAFSIDAYVPNGFSKVGNILYFSGYANDTGQELWRTDGTPTGTYLVKDINQNPHPWGAGASNPLFITDANGVGFFNATDGTAGMELWRTYGTEAGTAMVADILPGPGSSDPRWLVAGNGTLFFKANDGVHGRELWALVVPDSIPAISGMQILVLMGCLAVAGVMMIRRLKLGAEKGSF